MNLREMVREIGGARNLARWRAWYALEPRGETRADLLAAFLALFSGHTDEGETLGDLRRKIRQVIGHTETRQEEKIRKAFERRVSQIKTRKKLRSMTGGAK